MYYIYDIQSTKDATYKSNARNSTNKEKAKIISCFLIRAQIHMTINVQKFGVDFSIININKISNSQ